MIDKTEGWLCSLIGWVGRVVRPKSAKLLTQVRTLYPPLEIAIQLNGRASDSYPLGWQFNSTYRNVTWWLQPNGRAEVCGTSCESSILSVHTPRVLELVSPFPNINKKLPKQERWVRGLNQQFTKLPIQKVREFESHSFRKNSPYGGIRHTQRSQKP